MVGGLCTRSWVSWCTIGPGFSIQLNQAKYIGDLSGPGSGHYNDVTMGAIASQITSLPIVYSIVYSDADQRKHQSSASLAFVRGIHRGPVNFPHKWPVTRKMFPFDDVIMWLVASARLCTQFLVSTNSKIMQISSLPSKCFITATSDDRHGVSNFRSIECLFNSLFRLTKKKKHQKSMLLSLCEVNLPVNGGSPHI